MGNIVSGITGASFVAFVIFIGVWLIEVLSRSKESDSLPVLEVKVDREVYPNGLTRERTESGEINGNWIDLRASEDCVMSAGQYRIIKLGICIKMPAGYEGHVLPRSSTFKNFGIIMANSMGIIENTYCGDNDVWGFVAYATRDTEIHKGDRVAQFRIIESQDSDIGMVIGNPGTIKYVDHMEDPDRGGFGSSGKH